MLPQTPALVVADSTFVAVAIVAVVAVAFALLVGGVLLFTGRGRLYERYLRWRIGRGHVEEAIAWYRQRERFDEAADLMVSIGDLQGAARLYTKTGKPEKAAAALAKAGDWNAAALHYTHAKEYEAAAECFRELGDDDRAVRALVEAGEYGAAADIWLEQDQVDKAVTVLEEAGLLERAASVLATRNRFEEAADLLAREGLFPKAAPLYRKAGLLVKAAVALERANRSEEAARLLLDEGEPLLSAKVHARAGRFAEAAALFRANGAPDKAAEALLAAGDAVAAAHIFQELGDVERAAAIYEKAGRASEAGRLRASTHDRTGRFEQAAEDYLRAGNVPAAVDRFRRAGQPARAGEVLVQSGRFKDGATLLAEGQRFADAGAAFEKGGDAREAARCYLKAGRIEDAVRCFRAVGDHLTLARVHFKLGDADAALAVLGDIPFDSPQARDAVQMRARLLERREDLAGARDVLRAYLDAIGMTTETVDIACRVAEYEGRLGNAAAALEQLESLRMAGLAPPGFEEQFLFFQESVFLALDQTGREAFRRATGREAPAPPALGSPSRSSLARRRASSGGDPNAASLARPSTLKAATITMGFPWIGRYRFLEKLGAGSFGEVYRAHDTSLDRIVALKILLSGDMPSDTARSLFLKEARLVAKLNHPNIITVFDIGEFGGSVYIAMEFVDGENLADIMERRRGPLPLRATISIARQIAEALDYAHGHSVVHRDIKLENAMITPEGRIKILDFGVASFLDDPQEQGSVMAGTPHYMAPELVTSSRFDGRTDLYALGVLLYCLSTARFPFQDGNVLESQRFEIPPDPLLRNTELPRAFGDLTLKLLEKDPADRFQSAAEFLRALQTVHP